jgi:hypothetical protein
MPILYSVVQPTTCKIKTFDTDGRYLIIGKPNVPDPKNAPDQVGSSDLGPMPAARSSLIQYHQPWERIRQT